MAPFNPRVSPTNDPNYLSYSRGTDTPKADTSLGTLFSGLGESLGAVVQGVDQINQSNIQNELYQRIDSIRGEFGVDAAQEAASQSSLIPPDPSRPVPADASRAVADLDRLKTAFDEGKISESYYWARVESAVRQVRAKYPGYRDEIDSMVSKITGTTPANALRRSLMNDWEALQRQQAEGRNRFDTFFNQNLEYIDPTLRDQYLSGNNSSELQNTIRRDVAEKQMHMQNIQKQRAEIGLALDRNNLDAAKAQQYAINEVNTYINNNIIAGSNKVAGGRSFSQLQAQINSIISSGKPPTPEEINQIRANFAVLRNNVSTGVDQILTSPLTPGSPNSYSTVLTPERTKDIKAQALARLDAMEQMLIDGNFGMFSVNVNQAKAMNDATTRQILESSDAVRKLQAAQQALGPTLSHIFLNTEGVQLANDAAKAIIDLNLSEAVTGDPNQTLIDQVKRLQQAGIKDGKTYSAFLNQYQTALKNKDIPDHIIANMTKVIFDPDNRRFFAQFVADERKDVYSRLASPEVSQRLSSLKTSDPRAWDSYKNWVQNGFTAVFHAEASKLRDAIVYDRGTEVIFDPAKGQFSVRPSQDMVRGWNQQESVFRNNPNPMSAERAFELQKPGLISTVQGINQALLPLMEMYRQDGVDPAQAVSALISSMDLQPNQPKQDSLWRTLMKGLGIWEDRDGPDVNPNRPGGGENQPQRQGDAGSTGFTGFGLITPAAAAVPQEPAAVGSNAVADVETVEDINPQGQISLVSPQQIEQVQQKTGADPIEIASRFLGAHEASDRRTLSSFFKKSLGKNIDPVSTAWCAAFANSVLSQAGIEGTDSLLARSFLDFGTPVDEPRRGDIVVLSRGNSSWQGHVGFYQGKDENGNILILGGNQGNKVSVRPFSPSKVLGYRRPPTPEQVAKMPAYKGTPVGQQAEQLISLKN